MATLIRIAVNRHAWHSCFECGFSLTTCCLQKSLLNLLEPDAYRLDDLAAFRAKLESRREIGRLLRRPSPPHRGQRAKDVCYAPLPLQELEMRPEAEGSLRCLSCQSLAP